MSSPALGARAALGAFAFASLLLVTTPSASAGPLPYPWIAPTAVVPRTIESAIHLPEGFTRVPCGERSFCSWLRRLPLKPAGSPVMLFDGKQKRSRSVHAEVVDLDVGKTDLQQCADAILRLRAEYLWAAGRAADVEFPLTNGTRVPWSRWAAGERLKIKGKVVEWTTGGTVDASHDAFRAYLDFLFTYAGSESLQADLPQRRSADIQPGDVLVQGGSPGHAVLILDVARDASGTTLLLVGQSFMPAQDFHVLANLKHSTLSPWYHADGLETSGLQTPEWRPFKAEDLHGWQDSSK